MHSEAGANETLASVGRQVRDLFDEIEGLNGAENSDWAKFSNETQRFELWARNLGLYTGGHSSLDYRFRDAPLLFEHTFSLLKDLERGLSQLRIVVAKNGRNSPDIHDHPTNAEEGDNSGDSEEEDISSYLDKPLFEILIESTAATIDKLYRLAFKIRNPAMRLGNSRALTYREVDETTGVNLIDVFEDLDQKHIRDLFRNYSALHAENHYLVQRLAKANTSRRQQFRYWKKRREAFERLSLADLVDDAPQGPLREHPGDREELLAPAMLPIIAPSQPSTATRLNVENVRLDDDASVISTMSFIPIKDDTNDDSAFFPPPPNLGWDLKEFECPYCFTMSPRKLTLKKNWETHILRDLRPYICTYKDCKTPDQQYDSLNDWISHEALSHMNSDEKSPSRGTAMRHKESENPVIESRSSRDCPFCLMQNATPFHIASHLQRIASFSLPRSIGDDGSNEGSRISGQVQLRSQDSRISVVSFSDDLEFPGENASSGTENVGSPITLDTLRQQFTGSEAKESNLQSFLHGLETSAEAHEGLRNQTPLEKSPSKSPLLEAYYGTFNHIPDAMPRDVDSVSASSAEEAPDRSPYRGQEDEMAKADSASGHRSKNRHIDSTQDIGRELSLLRGTLALSEALQKTGDIDMAPFIRTLPRLTHDQMLDLRRTYKSRVRIRGRGVNLAKHVKMKLGNNDFGKICYVTALGQWESEAYWANCSYHSSTIKRRLVMEALLGRTNSEIRQIKQCFRDARYQDDLEECIKSELKADQFRAAILLALRGTRQSEDEANPSMVASDVDELREAVSRPGSESTMVGIIVTRNDSHLREVLREYTKTYKGNLAQEVIEKSKNSADEILSHILNLAVNKPMCGALFLRDALDGFKRNREYSELLISRLVRLHWEPGHFQQVKAAYQKYYGETFESHLSEEVGIHDFGNFCLELIRSSETVTGTHT